MVGEGLIEKLGLYLIEHRFWRIKLFACQLFRRSEEMRVAFSAVLRLEKSGKYILIRNLHRPESFAPLGGVCKYKEYGKSFLDSIEFRPHVVGPGNDMEGDLRGFIPRKNIHKLLKWYDETDSVENGPDCLRRELREELDEVKLPRRVSIPRDIQFKRIRRVREGPYRVPGMDYTQVRLYDVYEIADPNRSVKSMIKNVFKVSEQISDIVAVSAEEIKRGRSQDNSVLAHHCCYLIWNNRVRPDNPVFIDSPVEGRAC